MAINLLAFVNSEHESMYTKEVHVNEDNISDLKELLFAWIDYQPCLTVLFEIITFLTCSKRFRFQSVKQNLIFQVVDKSEEGKILLKCPVNECNQCIFVSLMRYPKYNKTKNRRKGPVLSAAKWYIYAVQSHLLKCHKRESEVGNESTGIADNTSVGSTEGENSRGDQQNEMDFNETTGSETEPNFHGFPSTSESNRNDNERNLGQRIQVQTQDIPENDGAPSTSNRHVQSPPKRKFRFAQSVRPYKKFKS